MYVDRTTELLSHQHKLQKLLLRYDRAKEAVVRAAKRYATNESEADFDEARLCGAVDKLRTVEAALSKHRREQP
jgi:hypothetical protein